MTDFTYLSCGAGVQSGTLVEMVVEGELEQPDMIIFADTGDEPQYVYDHIKYLGERLNSIGMKLTTVSAGNLIDDLHSGKGQFAAIPAYTDMDNRVSMLRRQCTREYKIAPIEAAMREELAKRSLATRRKNGIYRNPGVEVEAWIGISMDEVQRMKPSRLKWVTNRWPLIDKRMSRHDCRLWLKKRGLPIPGRSSCRICPYHNDDYWRAMKENAPDDWNHVVQFDESLRGDKSSRFAATDSGGLFLHRSCVPMNEVDLRTPEERGQMSLFDDYETACDGGYCFI